MCQECYGVYTPCPHCGHGEDEYLQELEAEREQDEQSRELPLGASIEYDQTTLQAIKVDDYDCFGCYFNHPEGCKKPNHFAECSDHGRDDQTTIIYKAIN